jgi:hypothetical protein
MSEVGPAAFGPAPRQQFDSLAMPPPRSIEYLQPLAAHRCQQRRHHIFGGRRTGRSCREGRPGGAFRADQFAGPFVPPPPVASRDHRRRFLDGLFSVRSPVGFLQARLTASTAANHYARRRRARRPAPGRRRGRPEPGSRSRPMRSESQGQQASHLGHQRAPPPPRARRRAPTS